MWGTPRIRTSKTGTAVDPTKDRRWPRFLERALGGLIGQIIKACFVILGVIFMENMWKRYVQIGGGIFLLLRAPVKSKFHGLKSRKNRFSWFSDCWNPLEPMEAPVRTRSASDGGTYWHSEDHVDLRRLLETKVLICMGAPVPATFPDRRWPRFPDKAL